MTDTTMADDFPRPEIGQYWQSKGGNTRIVCKAYIDPPGAQRGGLSSVWSYPKGACLGLVHEVEFTNTFVSIRVPDPCCHGRLVWVNVFRRGIRGAGIAYAYRTPPSIVRRWCENGWQHNWVYNSFERAPNDDDNAVVPLGAWHGCGSTGSS